MKCLQYIDFDDMVYYFVMLVFAFLYLCDDVMNIFFFSNCFVNG